MIRNVVFAFVLSLSSALAFVSAAEAAAEFPYNWEGAYAGLNFGLASGNGAGNANDCRSVTNIFGANGTKGFGNLCDAYQAGSAYGDWLDFGGCGCEIRNDNVYWLDHSDRNAAASFDIGVQVGRNWQRGNYVRGVEADLRYFGDLTQQSDQSFRYNEDYLGHWDGDYYARTTSSIDWLTTLRGRVGQTWGADGRLLTYATAGVALAVVSADMQTGQSAVGNVNWCNNCTFSAPEGTGTFVQPGVVAGFGLEYAVTDRISLGAEYLFAALGNTKNVTTHFTGDDGNCFELSRKVGFNDMQTISLKLNFKF